MREVTGFYVLYGIELEVDYECDKEDDGYWDIVICSIAVDGVEVSAIFCETAKKDLIDLINKELIESDGQP